jgi:hypothetical protein
LLIHDLTRLSRASATSEYAAGEPRTVTGYGPLPPFTRQDVENRLYDCAAAVYAKNAVVLERKMKELSFTAFLPSTPMMFCDKTGPKK